MVDPTAVPKTNTDSEPFTIAIVGGGIGGLVFGIGLLKQNVSFRIYEAAHHFAEIGAGLAFGPNAVMAMEGIDPAIRKGFDEIATGNGDEAHKHIWFQFRWGMDGDSRNGKLEFKGREKNRNGEAKAGDHITDVTGHMWGVNSVHRAHFLDKLVKLMPEENVSFGKKVERVEDRGEDRGVKLYFHDGTTSEATAVVGCDGIKSRVRESLLGKETAACFTGKYAYRGLVPMDEAASVLGNDIARNSQMHLGYDGHVLTFPIDKGRTMNVVAFQTKKDGKWEDDDWVVPMERSDMENDFASWGGNVKKILSLMAKPDVWALFDDPPGDTFTRGNICLLGDAAHASTPHNGAGAGMAIEDAYVLSKLLGRVKGGAQEVKEAFRQYNSLRRERALQLVTASRQAGELYEFQDREIGDDMEALKMDLGRRYTWIWEGDVTKEAS